MVKNLLLQGFGVSGNHHFFLVLNGPQYRRNQIGQTFPRTGSRFDHEVLSAIERTGHRFRHFHLLGPVFIGSHVAGQQTSLVEIFLYLIRLHYQAGEWTGPQYELKILI